MAWSYYIYYRVDHMHSEACRQAVDRLLQDVHSRTGIRGRVMTKRSEPLLWMEIYENVADEARFEWELAEAVAASGIASLLQTGSSRHTECFSEQNG